MCAMINGYGFDMGLGFGQIQTGGAPAQTLPATDAGSGDFFSGSPGLGESGPVSSNVNDLLGGIGSWATEGAQGQESGGGDQVQQIMQSVMEKLAQGDIQGALAELMKLLGGGQGQGQGQGPGGGGGGGGDQQGASPVQGGGGGGGQQQPVGDGGGDCNKNSNSGSDGSGGSDCGGGSNSNSTINNNITINNINICQDACDKEDTGDVPTEPAGDPNPTEPSSEPTQPTEPTQPVEQPAQPAEPAQPSGGDDALVPPPMERGKPS